MHWQTALAYQHLTALLLSPNGSRSSDQGCSLINPSCCLLHSRGGQTTWQAGASAQLVSIWCEAPPCREAMGPLLQGPRAQNAGTGRVTLPSGVHTPWQSKCPFSSRDHVSSCSLKPHRPRPCADLRRWQPWRRRRRRRAGGAGGSPLECQY